MTSTSSLSLRLLFLTGTALALLLVGQAMAGPVGFSVSVDGEHVSGDPVAPDVQRRNDVALQRTDIQVKFDGLDIKPMLNVLPADQRSTRRPGDVVPFLLTTNYPAFIARGELRIFEAGQNIAGKPLAIIEAPLNGVSNWTMPGGDDGEFVYVARVYDGQGRFDETVPLTLRRTARDLDDSETVAAGWGEDRTRSRTIPLVGGAVTVYGTSVPAGASVRALGETIPVDGQRAFVVQRILPAGDHAVDVVVAESGGAAMAFSRAINIPDNDWFYVAMADLTLGQRFGSGRLVAADPSEFDGIYAKGHLAFYLKGKIKGEYLLTAAADTGEGPLDQLFTGVLSKDPQALLRRIDPNQYYPVYGDDSTSVDDAPTRGKLYVRLERGASHVMWGQFRTETGNSAFVQGARSLYGASGLYKSETVTADGAHQASASAYAAHPGTLTQRDVLRGTGGSAYFLHRQDISPGSETVTIELRDATTGLVLSRRNLQPGVDYRINPMQGVIILNEPLSSSVSGTGAVQGAQGDLHAELVVQYEYIPIDPDLSDYALGGNGSVWLNDHVMVGATAQGDKTATSDQTLLGANVRVQATPTTFVEAEVMRSEGTGQASWVSTDGGLSYVQQAGAAGAVASAYRLNAQLDLADLGHDGLSGTAGTTVEFQEAGFSTPSRRNAMDQLVWRSFVNLEMGPAGLDVSYAHLSDGAGRRQHLAAAELRYELDPFWEIALGVDYLVQRDPSRGIEWNGERSDIGVRLTHRPNDDLSLYGFAQASLHTSAGFNRNDRVGGGLNWQLSEAIALGAELSYGTTGFGGLATISYQDGPDKRTYFGYRLTPEQQVEFGSTGNTPLSGLVAGTEQRLSEAVSVHAENTYSIFTRKQTLLSSYGVTLTPDSQWTISGAVETGRVFDPDASDFDRQAISLGTRYADKTVQAHIRGEVRFEDSLDDTRDRQSYLLATGVNWQTSDDWRLQASLDGVISRSGQAVILDGDYVEANIGYAYRPVDNERLEALFRYTYLHDLPGPQQVNAAGSSMGPAQRSHVLSVDANYDINEFITVGAKYGFRIGSISTTRLEQDFQTSSAHLGILRADIDILDDWAVLLEGRALYLPEAGNLDLGALAAVYRDVGDNVKLGLGYNFGQFSDDLKDLTYDDHGVFLNVIAAY